jgi:hypothetical protein
MKLYIAAAIVSILLVIVLFIAGRGIIKKNFVPQPPQAYNDPESLNEEKRALVSYLGLYYYYTEGYFKLCEEYGVDISEYKRRFIEINAEFNEVIEKRGESLNIDKAQVYRIIEEEHPGSFRAGVEAQLKEDNMTGLELCETLLREIAEKPAMFDLSELLAEAAEAE